MKPSPRPDVGTSSGSARDQQSQHRPRAERGERRPGPQKLQDMEAAQLKTYTATVHKRSSLPR